MDNIFISGYVNIIVNVNMNNPTFLHLTFFQNLRFGPYLRRRNRENLYFSFQNFQIWWLISGMEVMKK